VNLNILNREKFNTQITYLDHLNLTLNQGILNGGSAIFDF
jgi:hypothetical protein